MPPLAFSSGVRIELRVFRTYFFQVCSNLLYCCGPSSKGPLHSSHDLASKVYCALWGPGSDRCFFKRQLLMKKPYVDTAEPSVRTVFIKNVFSALGDPALFSVYHEIVTDSLILKRVQCLYEVAYAPADRSINLRTFRCGTYAAVFFTVKNSRPI